MADRGFDDCVNGERVSVNPNDWDPVIDSRSNVTARRPNSLVKKILASSIVGIMVFSSLVVLAPKLLQGGSPLDDSTARALAGEREITYRYTDFFDLGKKPEAIGSYAAYSELGRWNGTPGPPNWFALRETNYDEWIARDTYPYVLAYAPYSTQTTPVEDVGPVLASWYRLYIDADNITEMGTDPGEDPIFIPELGNPADPGGWYNLSWYSTYLNTQEIADARAIGSLHYSEFYYGANWAAVGMPRVANDDGYWHELQGKMNFSREACKKFLGMAGTGDLETEFTAEQATIEAEWYNKYMDDGGGVYDIYTAYDYSNDVRQVRVILDPDYVDYDPDTLYLRFWSLSWGNDCLLVRYLEQADVWDHMEGWADDWYLNVTVGPTMGDVDMRAVIGYHLTAWKDALHFTGGWTLETVHLDWCGNTNQHLGYTSPFNPYDPDQNPDVLHQSWVPGTMNYQNNVSYWLAPQEWDIAEGEKIIIELPTASKEVLAYEPYRAASDDLSEAKMTEYADHSYWGTLTVGNGWPYSGPTNLKNFYDEESRTMYLEGPIDFPTNDLYGNPGLFDTGSPTFFFGVSNVSEYELAIVEPGPYLPGVDYTLTVTAKNNSGTVTCNNTVDLSSTDVGAVFGLSAYKFNFSDAGVWSTTVRLSTAGSWTVYADDRNLEPDVDGSLGVTAIPEFGTLLIPVMGVAVTVFLLRARRRRHREG